MTLVIGILTRNIQGWNTQELIKAGIREGCRVIPFKWNNVISYISSNDIKFKIVLKDFEIDIVNEIDSIIVRPIGKCSLDQAIYRMDLLHVLQDLGVEVINKPWAIEIASDKFRTLYLLRKHGLPVPKTLVTENARLASRFTSKLIGNEIVIKPMFGSRGFGIFKLKLSDFNEIVWRIVNDLTYLKQVVYIQKFIEHKGYDIRLFVIDNQVIAGMYRIATFDWKTNIAKGGKPKPLNKIPNELQEIAVKACKVIDCEIAGVDVLEINGDYYILEVNSQPGWKGLQQVTKVNIAKEIIKYIKSKIKK